MLDLDRHQPDLIETSHAAPAEEYTDIPASAITEHDGTHHVEPADDALQEAITAPAEEDGSVGTDGSLGAAGMAGHTATISAVEAPRAEDDEPAPVDRDPDVDWGAGDPVPEGAEPDPDEVDLAPGGGDGGEPPVDEPPIGGGDFADEPDDNEDDHAGETAEPREVQLPLGIANEFFERSGAEAGDFAQHPQTAEDWHNNAVYSMASLAETEHEALAEGASRGRAAREATTLTNKYVEDGTSVAPTEDISAEHDTETYQSSRSPAPNVVTNYFERVDEATGEMEYVVKVQPEVPAPEFGDNVSLAEVQRQYAAYEEALQHPTEFIWESQQAHRVRILSGPEDTETMLHQLPVDKMIEAARFLRNAAIRGALARRNYPMVERLLPLE